MPKKNNKPIIETAVKYITYRMRSEAEVRKYLSQKGFEATEIELTISKLEEYEYIDDKRFAEELVRSKTARRPLGRRRLAQLLHQYGVSEDVAENALEAYSSQDEQSACDALFSKLIGIKGSDDKALAQIKRSMLQRGFRYEQIISSTRRLINEDVSDIE